MSPHPDTPRTGKRIAIAAAIVAIALGYVGLLTLLAWIAMQPLVAFDAGSVREKITLIERRPPAPVEPQPLPDLRAAARVELAMVRDPFK